MSDIFISYSRKDIAYARILHESLTENGFETWIDWQDIPPSTDWLNEVYAAIEQSDTFLFILSDSSTLSEICTLEIEHASKNNKRLIPIVINDVAPASVHPVLATINWIFSRTQDEFQPAIADLITAIQTDYDWVKAHTRLQIRALEWERANNDKSFLLRGADLSQAEEWFTRAAEKSPEPSLLQTQYLQTSRKEAVKRQRNLLMGVGLALIVSAVLGVVAVINGQRASSNAISLSTQVVVAQNAEATAEQEAFFRATQQSVAEEQRALAEEQQGIAEEQRDLVLARQLVAEAPKMAAINYDLSLLLSLEANNLAQDAPWTNGNLLEILQVNPRLTNYLRNNSDQEYDIFALAFSPDGKILASGGRGDNITLWDMDASGSPTILSQLHTGIPQNVFSLTFSPDGKVLASGRADNTVVLWDISSPKAPHRIGLPLRGHSSFVNTVAFNFDGDILASGSTDKTIILWDVSIPENPKPIGQPLSGHKDIVMSLDFSPDGKILASGSLDETIILWDISLPNSPKQFEQPILGSDRVTSVVFSPDGSLLASGSILDKAISLWDISIPDAPQQIGQPLTGHLDSISSLCFSQNSEILASSSADNSIILWDVSDPAGSKQIGEPLKGHSDIVSGISFSPDGQMLASGSYDGTIVLWDVSKLKQPKPLGFTLTDQSFPLDFNPDGSVLASGKLNDLVLWDLGDLDLPKAFNQPLVGDGVGQEAAVFSAAFSPDGNILASGYLDNTIVLWDVSVPSAPKRIGQPFSNHSNGVISVAFSPDGAILVSSSWDETIILWDISRPEAPKQIGQPLPNTSDFFSSLQSGGSLIGWSVVFSPDGSILASGSMAFVLLWDVSAPESPILIDMPLGFRDDHEQHSDLITGLAFSPDGEMLASGSWDNTIILWDISVPGEPKSFGQPLTGHSDIVWRLSFSPDGNMLASGSSDNTVILWDVTNPSAPLRLGQPLTGHSGVVLDVSFSPNGKILASGSSDFTVILWDVGSEAWKTRACNIAGRNLTQEEWDLYLPYYDYQQTCPQFP